MPHAGCDVVRIDPLYFMAVCRKRRLNQALSVFSVNIFFECIFCCLSGPLFVLILVCIYMCSVCWLLLVKLSVLAKWLIRRTLRMPLCGKEIISTKPRPKSAYDFRFIMLFILCFSCTLALHNIFHIPKARYSLFLLKLLLNTSQLTNHHWKLGTATPVWGLFQLAQNAIEIARIVFSVEVHPASNWSPCCT